MIKQTDNTILVLVDFSVSCPPDIKLQFTEIQQSFLIHHYLVIQFIYLIEPNYNDK